MKSNNSGRVWFRGAHLTNLEANRVGFAAIFGILGILIVETTIGTPNKYISFGLTLIIAAIGFYVASRIFKKKEKPIKAL
jgi:hypothetical protein